MKFWTIQHENAWNATKELGYLRGNHAYVLEGFIDHYRWMMEQMSNHLLGYQGHFPIWLWLNKPDLRHSGLNQAD